MKNYYTETLKTKEKELKGFSSSTPVTCRVPEAQAVIRAHGSPY